MYCNITVNINSIYYKNFQENIQLENELCTLGSASHCLNSYFLKQVRYKFSK